MISTTFAFATTVILASCSTLRENFKEDDSTRPANRVKRQWGWGGYAPYTYKFKTPFYKVKIKSPHPIGGFGPFGGFGGFHPAVHAPFGHGWNGWHG